MACGLQMFPIAWVFFASKQPISVDCGKWDDLATFPVRSVPSEIPGILRPGGSCHRPVPEYAPRWTSKYGFGERA